MSVAFSGEDPALAARMANAHAEAYVAYGLSMRTDASRDALEFLVEQATELRQRVHAAQTKLAAYRAQHGVVALNDPQDDRPNAVLERLTELNKRLTEAETLRMAREADYRLRKRGAQLPTALESPLLASLKENLARLETQYAALLRRYSPEHPNVPEAKAAVEKAREQLKLEIRHLTKGIESAYLAALEHENVLREEVQAPVGAGASAEERVGRIRDARERAPRQPEALRRRSGPHPADRRLRPAARLERLPGATGRAAGGSPADRARESFSRRASCSHWSAASGSR